MANKRPITLHFNSVAAKRQAIEILCTDERIEFWCEGCDGGEQFDVPSAEVNLPGRRKFKTRRPF
jgi:hypothetical protein